MLCYVSSLQTHAYHPREVQLIAYAWLVQTSLVPSPSPPPVFFMLAVCKNGGRRPKGSYHVIYRTGVTCCYAYMHSHAVEKTNLAFCSKLATGRDKCQWSTKSNVQSISKL